MLTRRNALRPGKLPAECSHSPSVLSERTLPYTSERPKAQDTDFALAHLLSSAALFSDKDSSAFKHFHVLNPSVKPVLYRILHATKALLANEDIFF